MSAPAPVPVPAPASRWSAKNFKELSLDELYALLKLRSDVFVVEQACAYPDLDGADRTEGVVHLMDYDDSTATMRRYARLGLDKNDGAVHIGRVVVSPAVRGKGQGRELVARAVQEAESRWPGRELRLAAQTYAQKLYSGQGFVVSGPVFLEDGIEHVHMARAQPKSISGIGEQTYDG